MDLEKIEINADFEEAIKKMEDENTNLFITGKAGAGKSTLLSYFCKNTKKEYAVLAPTGVAALNVKGQTIHRFFNFYVDITPTKIQKGEVKPKEDNEKLYKNIKTIIIDEVSMLRADLLDCIDIFLKHYGPSPGERFGGVQMIFIGDLYQLPPVVIGKEAELFNKHYQSPYFFSSHAFENFEIEVIELDKIYRQKDINFINLLNKIRNNSVESNDIELLNTRHIGNYKPEESKFFINLTSTNSKADEINKEYLSKLKGKAYKSTAEILGDFDKSSYPTSVELEYKLGSQIMLLNNDSNDRWVNGTIATIEKKKKDEEGREYLVIRLIDKKKYYNIAPYKWEISRYYFDGIKIESEVVGSFVQYPFRLAWAITIHKSQGKTFDNVIIDIGRGVFATGQMYVALSRCTSFEGVILKTPIKKNHIRTDYRIFSFLTKHQYQKSEKTLFLEDKITIINQAIKEEKKLEIIYLKANDTKSKRIISPYSVKNEKFKGKSFIGIKAYCHNRFEERMFRVDRILKLNINV